MATRTPASRTHLRRSGTAEKGRTSGRYAVLKCLGSVRSKYQPELFGQFIPAVGFAQYGQIFLVELNASGVAHIPRCQEYFQFGTKGPRLDR